MIDKRPRYINERKRIGDMEGDFVESGKAGSGLLFVCTDRKARAVFLEKIWPVSIPAVERAIGRIKKRFPEMKTMTFDNDLLFIHHQRLERKFGIRIYFCHRYSAWEKGGVGRLARVRQIEALIADGVERIELGSGHYPHKIGLGGVEYPLRSILVSRNHRWPRLKARVLAVYADMLNLLYYRIWFGRLAPRLPLPRRPLWKAWIRTRV